MASFRGIGSYVGDNAERVRIYLVEPIGSFVEFERDAVGSVQFTPDVGTYTLCTVEVDDGAVEAGVVESDAFDAWFAADSDRTVDRLDRFVAAQDPRDAERSLDGTNFRCCYTQVYC
jgi:RPA family protein